MLRWRPLLLAGVALLLSACFGSERVEPPAVEGAHSLLLVRGVGEQRQVAVLALDGSGRFVIGDDQSVSGHALFLVPTLEALQLKEGPLPSRPVSKCKAPRPAPTPMASYAFNTTAAETRWFQSDAAELDALFLPDLEPSACSETLACVATVAPGTAVCAACEDSLITPPAPPEPPELPADCAGDPVACGLADLTPCPQHEARFVKDGGACTPIGTCITEQPDMPFFVYVVAGASPGGTGSRAQPFRFLYEATGAPHVALGAGVYDADSLGRIEELVGLCPALTTLRTSTIIHDPGADLTIRNLHIQIADLSFHGAIVHGFRETLENVELVGSSTAGDRSIGLKIDAGGEVALRHSTVSGFTLNQAYVEGQLIAEDAVFEQGPTRALQLLYNSTTRLLRTRIASRRAGSAAPSLADRATVMTYNGTSLALDRVVFAGYQYTALELNNGIVTGSDVIVQGPPLNPSGLSQGAIRIGDLSALSLDRVLISQSYNSAVSLLPARLATASVRDLTTLGTRPQEEPERTASGALYALGPMAEMEIVRWESFADEVVTTLYQLDRVTGADWTIHHAPLLTTRPLRIERSNAIVQRMFIDGMGYGGVYVNGGNVKLEDLRIQSPTVVYGLDVNPDNGGVALSLERVVIDQASIGMRMNGGHAELSDARFTTSLSSLELPGDELEALDLGATRFFFSAPTPLSSMGSNRTFEFISGQLAGEDADDNARCAHDLHLSLTGVSVGP